MTAADVRPDDDIDPAPELTTPEKPARATKPARTRTAARHFSPVAGLRNWLDRPLTSWHLILAVFGLLLVFGLLMVLSASAITDIGRHRGPFSTFEVQAIVAAVGLVGFVVCMRLSPKTLRRWSFPAVLVSIGLLGIVLLIGPRIGGARSWIPISGFTFQPSEIAKLALLLWMAHVLAARRLMLRSLRALLIPVLPVFLLIAGLIIAQPDLGTTIALSLVFFAVLFYAGAPWWLFAGLSAVGAAGAVAFAISAGYRSARVMSWLHPTKDNSYQLYQGLYGMGHGGVFGAGLGQSVAKWGSLPASNSDFIFAIIGEELGLVGTGLVLVLFGLLAYTGFRIARRNTDPFIKIVSAGATVWLVGQAAINIGYVTGLLPVTGITLPMISTGGTSLLVTMVVFGVLANFARREPAAAAALHAQGPGLLARFLGIGAPPVPGDSTELKPLRRRAQARAERKAQAKEQQREQRRARSRERAQQPRSERPARPERQARSVRSERSERREPARGERSRGSAGTGSRRVRDAAPPAARRQGARRTPDEDRRADGGWQSSSSGGRGRSVSRDRDRGRRDGRIRP
jgi:cell division protein FtsW